MPPGVGPRRPLWSSRRLAPLFFSPAELDYCLKISPTLVQTMVEVNLIM